MTKGKAGAVAPAPSHTVDLIQDSLEQILAVSFPKSRGSGYPLAVAIAQKAKQYTEADMGGTLFHFAVFGREKEQIALAYAITRYLSGLKSVEFFAGGKMISVYDSQGVLRCYLDSVSCNDYRAHCNKVVSHPFKEEERIFDLELDGSRKKNNYLHPCAYLLQWHESKLTEDHPASAEDQLQAMAIKRGCDWCPNFKPGDFRKL